MICTDCKQQFASSPNDYRAAKSIYGVCPTCKAKTRREHWFANGFGAAAAAVFLSLEFVFVSLLIDSWTFLVSALVATVLVYGVCRRVFFTEVLRGAAESRGWRSWGVEVLGGASGLVWGWLWLYLGLFHSEFWP